MYTYKDYVIPFLKNFKKVSINEEQIEKINTFTEKVIIKKGNEKNHKIDFGERTKRFKTGMGGEVALENYLDEEFVDWGIGESREFNTSDLKGIGLKVGVKTVERGKFPLIHKKAVRPEIIFIKHGEDKFILCGLATIEILDTYQSDSLILSPNVRKLGKKTGFYGFEHLKSFQNLGELKTLLVKEKQGI